MIFKRLLGFLLCLFLSACQNGAEVVQNQNVSVFGYDDYGSGHKVDRDLWHKNILVKADATFSLSILDDVAKEEDLASIKTIAKYLESNKNIKVKLLGHTNTDGSLAYNNALFWMKMRDIASYFEQNGIDYERISIISLGSSKHNSKSQSHGTVEVFYEGAEHA